MLSSQKANVWHAAAFTYQSGIERERSLVALARMQLVSRHLPVPVTKPLKGLRLLQSLLSSSLKQLSMAVLTLSTQLTAKRPVDPVGSTNS